MIKEIYLFTNRNLMAFDGEDDIVEIQRGIGWERRPAEDERRILQQIIEDQPRVFLCRWMEWAHEITLDEFCSILGHGRWYWENYL